MPELPEVETICRGLRPLLARLTITDVKVLESRLRNPISPNLHSELNQKTILDVQRRGKYILISLKGNWVWIIHLGMSGKLVFVKPEQPRARHDHIVVSFDSGHELRYNDPRRFGLSAVVARAELVRLSQMANLGLDPLDRRFNADYLRGMARHSKRRVRDLLIDQTVAAGLGNIYVNEILFQAGVRPTRRAWTLKRQEIGRIAQVTPKVLQRAIRWRGTSFSDYRDGEDRKGEFQNYLRVYDRAGEKCRVCGTQIKAVRLGNRGAFYCSRCQK
jgi:formamidopyrimidine-DNA glycosylase